MGTRLNITNNATDFIKAAPTTGPRVLVADLESFPLEAYVWSLWKQNVGLDQIKQDWTMMSFAAKWLDKPEVFYDDVSNKRNVRDDAALMRKIHKLLMHTDIVIAHNGEKFDMPKLRARMALAGLPPTPQIAVIDTLRLNRKAFGFTSHRLAYVSDRFADDAKDDHANFPGFKLWRECLAGNPDAWAECKAYNIRDVTSLEETYKALRGWYEGAPNLGTYADPNGDDKPVCPNCGGTHLRRKGTRTTQVGIYPRYHCQDCGGWSRGRYMSVSREDRAHIVTN